MLRQEALAALLRLTPGGAADAATSSVFDALLGFGLAVQTCDALRSAFLMCQNTHGADCAPETAFDESCAAIDSAHPQFQYCKLTVARPATCVDYNSVAPNSGWYCCE